MLRRACDLARAHWPAVPLVDERFVRHLAERLPAEVTGPRLEAALAELSLGELYLACACAEGAPAAILALEEEYMARLPRHLAGRGRSADLVDEVCQRVRELFLLPSPAGGPPGIGAYAGRGRLMSWVQVAAARVARRMDAGRAEDVPDVLDRLPASGLNPELDLIRRTAEREFRACLGEAVTALSAEERHLLRLHHSGGLSTVAMARLFGVSQPTISRRLQGVRASVLQETRRLLKERLALGSSDLQSFLGALDSRLDASISQLLGRGP